MFGSGCSDKLIFTILERSTTHRSSSESMDCNDVKRAISGFSLVVDCGRIDNGLMRLATPFRYPDGSLIDVFVLSDPSRLPQVPSFTISDLGQTTANLLDMHIKTWTTKKRKQAVADVCASLGVAQRGGEFVIELASLSELSDAIVRLSQACIRVSDLIFTQRISAPVSFRDDVEEFLRPPIWRTSRKYWFQENSIVTSRLISEFGAIGWSP